MGFKIHLGIQFKFTEYDYYYSYIELMLHLWDGIWQFVSIHSGKVLSETCENGMK